MLCIDVKLFEFFNVGCFEMLIRLVHIFFKTNDCIKSKITSEYDVEIGNHVFEVRFFFLSFYSSILQYFLVFIIESNQL